MASPRGNVFTGVKPPKSADGLILPPYEGDPCLYKSHGETEVYRDGNTHACLCCMESIEDGEISFDLDRLKPRARQRAINFWNSVVIGSLDDCWQWTRPNLQKSGVAVMWPRPKIRKVYKFHAVLVANWLTWGDIGRNGVISTCGQRRCVNPLHQIPDTFHGLALLDKVNMQEAEVSFRLLKSQLSAPTIEEPEDDPALAPKGLDAIDPSSFSEALYKRNLKLYDQLFEAEYVSDKR